MSDSSSTTGDASLALGRVGGAPPVADPWDELTRRGLAAVRARRTDAEREAALKIENAWRASRQRSHLPRAPGRRASRVARVLARKAAAKATADPDGEPPAEYGEPPEEFRDKPIVTPAIDDVVEIAMVRGPNGKAFHFAGVGALFVSQVTGGSIIEAVAFGGPGFEARHAWLQHTAEQMFGGRLEPVGQGGWS